MAQPYKNNPMTFSTRNRNQTMKVGKACQTKYNVNSSLHVMCSKAQSLVAKPIKLLFVFSITFSQRFQFKSTITLLYFQGSPLASKQVC